MLLLWLACRQNYGFGTLVAVQASVSCPSKMVFHDPLATYVPEKTQKRLRRRQRKMPGDKGSSPNVPADFLAEGLENVRAWRDRCVQNLRCDTWREMVTNCVQVHHGLSSVYSQRPGGH